MSTGWITTGAVWLALAVGPVVVLALRSKVMGRLTGTALIAIWGLVIPVLEHTLFGITEGTVRLTGHAQVHALMGLIYWPLGAAGLAVVMWTLLREGRRIASFLLLGLLVVGRGAEMLRNRPTGLVFQHGFASNSRPEGMALYAYPVAWVRALVISYRPIFRPPAPREELTR